MPRRFVATAMAPTVLSLVIMLALALISQIEASQQQEKHTLARKSIVFDLKTPKVFYCPQEKPTGDQLDKMIVKARPLDKLCEFEGKQKPRGAQSDCYNDVDETEFACDEKKRFMIRLDLASEGLDSGTKETVGEDLDFILSSGGGSNKKKTLPNEKKKMKSIHN